MPGGNPNLNTTIAADWTKPTTHRLDWVPNLATFFANDGPSKKLTEGVPTEASTLSLNMWSSGNQWGGAMAAGGSASMNIEWIEMVYDTESGYQSKRAVEGGRRHARRWSSGSRGCTNVCNVDGVAVKGTPELAK